MGKVWASRTVEKTVVIANTSRRAAQFRRVIGRPAISLMIEMIIVRGAREQWRGRRVSSAESRLRLSKMCLLAWPEVVT